MGSWLNLLQKTAVCSLGALTGDGTVSDRADWMRPLILQIQVNESRSTK